MIIPETKAHAPIFEYRRTAPIHGTTFYYPDSQSGMTPLLQFLDVHINKPFKDQLKDQYEVLIDEEKKEYTLQLESENVRHTRRL